MYLPRVSNMPYAIRTLRPSSPSPSLHADNPLLEETVHGCHFQHFLKSLPGEV